MSEPRRTGDFTWWQRGLIYQIYPRSFADSDGDGVGDLRGILGKLDYLEWLGVDAVWLSPIYPSPMADFGYDVSDYTGIHPLFGTMADFDALVATLHARGKRLLLDFVPNHSSSEHPWFAESRASREHPRRDWYIWRDPAPDGGPPNNWLSNFGGSAWELDARTGQYYYHAFLKEQPDLNWRNPAVQDAMLDAMRFWLDRGVDGFRVDVIWHLVKDDLYRDNPRDPDYVPTQPPHRALLATYNTDRPEVHEIIARMRELLDAYPERLLIGEIYLAVERLVTYYGIEGRGVHLPFNFQLLQLPWNAGTIAGAVNRYEAALPPYGWPNWVLGNHDVSRIASRVGEDQTATAAMLLLMLRGTPTLYYGDELGMRNVPIPQDQVQDPFEKNVPGMGFGRDPVRTPMQWSGEPGAGFSSAKPWLPLAEDYASRNVMRQRDDPASLLSFYRRAITHRQAEAAFTVGEYQCLGATAEWFAFIRRHGGRSFLVALNFGGEPAALNGYRVRGEVALDTHHTREGERISGHLRLAPNQSLVVALEEDIRG